MPPKTTKTQEAGPEKARVLSLHARNVKCVKEVAINFDGDIQEIRGDSGQGKTTILTAIEGALRGLDPEMVRKGESAAEIELHLTEGRIKRIVPADGSAHTLMVTDKNGAPVAKAKDFLNTIVASGDAFRPIAWVQLGGGEDRGRTERLRRQRDQLLEGLAGCRGTLIRLG